MRSFLYPRALSSERMVLSGRALRLIAITSFKMPRFPRPPTVDAGGGSVLDDTIRLRRRVCRQSSAQRRGGEARHTRQHSYASRLCSVDHQEMGDMIANAIAMRCVGV